MKRLVLLGLVVSACSAPAVVETTTTVNPLAEEVADLTGQLEQRDTDIRQLTDANDDLSTDNANLVAEVDRLEDEIDQLEGYVEELEMEFASWVDWALQLETALSEIQSLSPPEPTGPSAQWCAEYLLALETAAYARLNPGTDPVVIGGISFPGRPPEQMHASRYVSEVVEPLESIGCPRPEGY